MINKKLLFRTTLALAVVFVVYEITSAIYISRTTGDLRVTTPNKTTLITLSQAGHAPFNLGYGKAHVRVLPGTYEIIGTDNQAQSEKTIRVKSREFATVALQPEPTTNAAQTKKIVAANALIKLLPYTGPSYSYVISYDYTFTSAIAQPTILITAPTRQAQQAALAWVSHMGFNPSDLPIKYIAESPRAE